MMSNRLVHLELHTGDLSRACAFYGRLCGWRPQEIHALHSGHDPCETPEADPQHEGVGDDDEADAHHEHDRLG